MRRHSASAGAIVTREDGRFLAVQRRDTGAWVTPGGILEPGEPLREAAAREVYEETGVAIDVGTLVGIYQNLSTEVITFVFHARPLSGQHQHTSDETSHVRWITPTEAEDIMAEPFAIRVRDAYQHQEPVIRTLTEPQIMTPKDKRSTRRSGC